jgi:hypothetical protein
MDPSLFLRQLVNLSPARYAHAVFIGGVLGLGLDAVQQWMALANRADSTSIVCFGISVVVLPTWLIGAARRTQRIRTDLELLETIVQRGKLSEGEQRRLYREVAQRLADAIGEEALRAAVEKAKSEPQRELPG